MAKISLLARWKMIRALWLSNDSVGRLMPRRKPPLRVSSLEDVVAPIGCFTDSFSIILPYVRGCCLGSFIDSESWAWVSEVTHYYDLDS
jgi:hypothetical protein